MFVRNPHFCDAQIWKHPYLWRVVNVKNINPNHENLHYMWKWTLTINIISYFLLLILSFLHLWPPPPPLNQCWIRPWYKYCQRTMDGQVMTFVTWKVRGSIRVFKVHIAWASVLWRHMFGTKFVGVRGCMTFRSAKVFAGFRNSSIQYSLFSKVERERHVVLWSIMD